MARRVLLVLFLVVVVAVVPGSSIDGQELPEVRPSPQPEACGSRILACGQMRAHELGVSDCYEGGYYATGFYLTLNSSAVITFHVNSFEFEPYIYAFPVANPELTIGQNTNASRSTDPSLTLSLSAGAYVMVVSTVDKFDRGVFSVRLDCSSAASPSAAGDPLVLLDKRFRVMLEARDHRTNKTAGGLPIPQTDGFGYFSLPGLTGDAANPEVFVKILDGTPVNGRIWVFYGGLTDLELTLRVTDLSNGAAKTYVRPGASAAGGFDVSAFCASPVICKSLP